MLSRAWEWFRKRNWKKLLVPLLIAITLLLVGSTAFSPSYRNCAEKQEEQTSKDQQPGFRHQVGTVIFCEAVFAQENNGAITAIATLFVAIFTLTLWLASTEQSRLTRTSIELTNKEFIASHRPRIVVRSVTFMLEGANQNPVGQRLMVRFELANVGNSAAKIIGTSMEIQFLNRGSLRMIVPPRRGNFALPGWGNVEIAAGQCLPDCWFGNPEHTYDEAMLENWGRDIGLFFCGHLLYEDGNGVVRRTSFCRRYDEGLGYWPKSTYYDYEHED